MEKVQHAENALENTPDNKWIDVQRDVEGRARVTFVIQSAPVSEVGVNGCQAVNMLEYTKNLFKSLNDVFPCEENVQTLISIEQALSFQEQRTKDREKRNVEGKNEA